MTAYTQSENQRKSFPFIFPSTYEKEWSNIDDVITAQYALKFYLITRRHSKHSVYTIRTYLGVNK